MALLLHTGTRSPSTTSPAAFFLPDAAPTAFPFRIQARNRASSPATEQQPTRAFSLKSGDTSDLRRLPGASSNSDGIPLHLWAPSELVEGPKFVPLNTDDPVYGPPALLLMGFDLAETNKIRKFLKELDGEFLKIIHCTEDMMSQSIWDAVHTEQPNLKDVKVLKSFPRICFLSGLSGEEMMMFIDAFPEIGLRPAVFAALVPNSADKLLKEVSEEIMGDHEMLSAKK